MRYGRGGGGGCGGGGGDEGGAEEPCDIGAGKAARQRACRGQLASEPSPVHLYRWCPPPIAPARTLRITSGVMGRAADCIIGGAATVSRRHALIAVSASGSLTIAAIGANSLVCDGVVLDITAGPAPLPDGARIVIGGVPLVVGKAVTPTLCLSTSNLCAYTANYAG